jgi:hypothetical protein
MQASDNADFLWISNRGAWQVGRTLLGVHDIWGFKRWQIFIDKR